MKSIRYLFRIGNGPSSSHTIGPYRICRYIKVHYPDAIHVDVTLYGSFALTGRGHMTDKAISETLKPLSSKIIFEVNGFNVSVIVLSVPWPLPVKAKEP